MSNDEQQTYVVTTSMTLAVSSAGELETWVSDHVESLPDISFSDDWTDPTDPDGDEPQPAYISDSSVYLPSDPQAMLQLAAQCLINGLPGVEIQESDWNVDPA
jgi:hypothetical protein